MFMYQKQVRRVEFNSLKISMNSLFFQYPHLNFIGLKIYYNSTKQQTQTINVGYLRLGERQDDEQEER
ncbi:hypothetical protein pb186bvf_001431 [Paramecium bursaria]